MASNIHPFQVLFAFFFFCFLNAEDCPAPQRTSIHHPHKETIVDHHHHQHHQKKENILNATLPRSFHPNQATHLDPWKPMPVKSQDTLSRAIGSIVRQLSVSSILSQHDTELGQLYISDDVTVRGPIRMAPYPHEQNISNYCARNGSQHPNAHDDRRFVFDFPADGRVILDCIGEILGRINRRIRDEASYAILSTTSDRMYKPIWWRSRPWSSIHQNAPNGDDEISSDQGLVSEGWLHETLGRKLRLILSAPPLTVTGYNLAQGSVPKPLVVQSRSSKFIYNKMMNIIKVDQLFSQEEYGWTTYSNPCIFNNYAPNLALDLGDAVFEELLMETIQL